MPPYRRDRQIQLLRQTSPGKTARIYFLSLIQCGRNKANGKLHGIKYKLSYRSDESDEGNILRLTPCGEGKRIQNIESDRYPKRGPNDFLYNKKDSSDYRYQGKKSEYSSKNQSDKQTSDLYQQDKKSLISPVSSVS